MMRFLTKDMEGMVREVDSSVSVCMQELLEGCSGLRTLAVFKPRVEELEGVRGRLMMFVTGR